jgi:hypothetical protein
MLIYHCVPGTGLFCGQDTADESPLEPGVYLIPAYATELVPPTPGANQQAVFLNGAWTVQDIPIPTPAPVPTAVELLATAQESKVAAIQATWQAQEQGGFPYLGKTIQSDPINAQRITFASIGAQAAITANTDSAYTGSWLCADGTLLPLTAQQTVGMADAFAVFGLGIYNHAQALLLQVQAATTVTAVQGISNW